MIAAMLRRASRRLRRWKVVWKRWRAMYTGYPSRVVLDHTSHVSRTMHFYSDGSSAVHRGRQCTCEISWLLETISEKENIP